MKIQAIALYSYEIPLRNSQARIGMLINIQDERGCCGWGDIAPLASLSQETLQDVNLQFQQKKHEIYRISWSSENCFRQLAELKLFPSFSFGLETAILSLLKPLSEFTKKTSALLMGSPQDILKQGRLRFQEGYTSAKLKVGHLNFEEAGDLILQLKDLFRLRIDVNRCWSVKECLQFFSHFPDDAFDYVEEPFQNPLELKRFSHPLAVDESFPDQLSLEQLEVLPTLKSVIYKPTIHGGILGCRVLQKWADARGISIVLSSSFESDIGLASIAAMACRLSLSSPIGIGTFHHLSEHLAKVPIKFVQDHVHVSSQSLHPNLHKLKIISGA